MFFYLVGTADVINSVSVTVTSKPKTVEDLLNIDPQSFKHNNSTTVSQTALNNTGCCLLN